MLYELSTGQHPYRDEDAPRCSRNVLEASRGGSGRCNPQLSPFFEEVVHTLLGEGPDGALRLGGGAARRAGGGRAVGVVAGAGQGAPRSRRSARSGGSASPVRRRSTAGTRSSPSSAPSTRRPRPARARSLLIEGEAGIGKTRLVDEFVGRLRQDGEDLNFLFGSYPPGGAATAAGAFSTAYREHFGSRGLEETLGSYLTATPLLIPAFAALLRGEPPPTGAEPLTKDSLQTVFVHATRGLAAERPTVVLIDDLHFAPEEGRALFASLALAVPGPPDPAGRDDAARGPGGVARERSRGWSTPSSGALARLGPKDLAKLLSDAFHSERLAEELGLQIAAEVRRQPVLRLRDHPRPAGGAVHHPGARRHVGDDEGDPGHRGPVVGARSRQGAGCGSRSEEERDLSGRGLVLRLRVRPRPRRRCVWRWLAFPLSSGLPPRDATSPRAVRGEHFVFDHHQVQEASMARCLHSLRGSTTPRSAGLWRHARVLPTRTRRTSTVRSAWTCASTT